MPVLESILSAIISLPLAAIALSLPSKPRGNLKEKFLTRTESNIPFRACLLSKLIFVEIFVLTFKLFNDFIALFMSLAFMEIPVLSRGRA